MEIVRLFQKKKKKKKKTLGGHVFI